MKKKTNCGIFLDLHCSQERGFCIDPTGNGVALQNFWQLTKVYWLSLGPSIVRLLKQWKLFCHFVAVLPQEEKTNLKNINCKQVATLHLNIEKTSQKSCLNSKKILDICLGNLWPSFRKLNGLCCMKGCTIIWCSLWGICYRLLRWCHWLATSFWFMLVPYVGFISSPLRFCHVDLRDVQIFNLVFVIRYYSGIFLSFGTIQYSAENLLPIRITSKYHWM